MHIAGDNGRIGKITDHITGHDGAAVTRCG